MDQVASLDQAVEKYHRLDTARHVTHEKISIIFGASPVPRFMGPPIFGRLQNSIE